MYDFADNCRDIANASQCDTDADGFGNHCDAGLDNNLMVNTFDMALLRSALGSTGAHLADLDCDGVVNSFDLARLRGAAGQ